MGYIKSSIKESMGESNSMEKLSKEYIRWYDDISKNRDDFSIEYLSMTDPLQLGKMYRFRYFPVFKDKMEWYDKYPLIMSFGILDFTTSKVELAINLNLVPYDIKILFMDELTDTYKALIMHEISGKNANRAKKQKSLDVSYSDIQYIINKYNMGFATRNYYKYKMKNIAVISYENWGKMLLIDKFFFHNIGTKSVYKRYYEYTKTH